MADFDKILGFTTISDIWWSVQIVHGIAARVVKRADQPTQQRVSDTAYSSLGSVGTSSLPS